MNQIISCIKNDNGPHFIPLIHYVWIKQTASNQVAGENHKEVMLNTGHQLEKIKPKIIWFVYEK